jgi:alpha-D-xyloside xylohydrolase
MMRPMVLAFPDDPNTYGLELQYMLGPDLLVAPVYNPEGARPVYLPEGDWVDYWTGDVKRGPQQLRLTVPIDQIPLFTRRGARLG